MAIDKIETLDSQDTTTATAPALATSTSASEQTKPMSTAASIIAEADSRERKQAIGKRSVGQWIYDFMLYPVLNNTTVFLTSVAIGYLSNNGGKEHSVTGKPVFGRIGTWFKARSDNTDHFFKNVFGMKDQKAIESSRIVAWSFIDGSLLSIPVKLMENKREHVARGIDSALGTTPADTSVYEAEPKQTWLSVLGGRISTATIVVGTALAFQNIKVTGKNGKIVNLNQKMFQGGADKLEAKIRSVPNWNSFFEKPSVKEAIDLNNLSYLAIFEAVYTTICTAGLWIGSRTIAALQGNWNPDTAKATKQQKNIPASIPAPVNKPTEAEPVVANYTSPQSQKSVEEKPSTRVENISHANRIEQLPAHAVGA